MLHIKLLTKPQFCLLALIGLVGCAHAPDYQRPVIAAMDDAFINAPDTATQQPIAAWWQRLFGEGVQADVELLLAQNLDLQAAQQRIVQMQQGVLIQQAADTPNLSLASSVGRSFAPNIMTGERTYADLYSIQLSSSWEADLFGKRDAAQQAAGAQLAASHYDHQALQQALIAQLVKLRINLTLQQQLLALAQQKQHNRSQTHELLLKRYQLGVAEVTAQNVWQAEQGLHNAESEILTYQRQLNELLYQLDVLLGKRPGTSQHKIVNQAFSLPTLDVALCLPIDLLDRRPDLRASELRLLAANANIGVALADLYPSLGLSASLGSSAAQWGNVLQAQQFVGSLVANVVAKLFDGGRSKANVAIQRAKVDELANSYAQTVLNALREVETQLQAEQKMTLQQQQISQTVAAQKQLVSSKQLRYQQGLLSASDQLEAEFGLLSYQQQQLNILQNQWITRIGLYQALGGDWLDTSTTENCSKEMLNEQTKS